MNELIKTMNRLGVSTFLLLNFLSFDVLSLDCASLSFQENPR